MSVIFDQLRISDDGRQLFINAHVNRAKAVSVTNEGEETVSPFEDVYITKVVVVDANDVSETLPLDSIPSDKYLFSKEYSEKDKVTEIDLMLDVNNMMRHGETDIKKIDFCQEDMYKTLFFVYVQTTEVNSCLPCYMTKPVTVGVTFDENAFYQKVMNYTRELAEDCENIPKGFTDFILQWNAFKSAVETEHFLPAIKFYNLMFGNGSSDTVYTSTKGCGCHGRSRI